MSDVAALRNAGLLAARAFSPKALHIRVYPVPIDVAERRGILKVLRGYGEVDTFRSLRWDHPNPAPNSSLAIFREGDAAHRLVGDSPLRFTLEPLKPEENQEPSNPYMDLFNKLEAQSKSRKGTLPAEAASLPGHKDPAANGSTADPFEKQRLASQDEQHHTEQHHRPPPPKQRPRQFIVHASPWTSNLSEAMERTPHAGPFAINTKPLSHQDLAKRVPLPGLSVLDLTAPPVPSRIVTKRRAALEKRKTLRQIMEGKGRDDSSSSSSSSNLAHDDMADVAGISTLARDWQGGLVDRAEAERRAAGNFTDARDPTWDSPMTVTTNVSDAVQPRQLERPRGPEDVYAQARRRNLSPWSRRYDRMI